MKPRKKKKNVALLFGIIAIAFFYITVPLFLQFKAQAIIKTEKCLKKGDTSAPTAQLSIAINFLDYAALFPGFTQMATQKKENILKICRQKYKLQCKIDSTNKNFPNEKVNLYCKKWTKFVEHAKIKKCKNCR